MPDILFTILLAMLLGIACWIDAKTRRLPNIYTYSLIAVGLARAAFGDDLLLAVAGAATGYSAFWLVAIIYRNLRGFEGLGLGDAKMLAAAGAWLGPAFLAPVVLLAACLGLIYIVFLRIRGAAISSTLAIAFGPFLGASFFVFWSLNAFGGG